MGGEREAPEIPHVLEVLEAASGEAVGGVLPQPEAQHVTEDGGDLGPDEHDDPLVGALERLGVQVVVVGNPDEVEPHRRGPYAGAVGYFGYSDRMDMCIGIRTIVVKGTRAYIGAGAGIVADSVPELEYQETLNKASALKRAIERAARGFE